MENVSSLQFIRQFYLSILCTENLFKNTSSRSRTIQELQNNRHFKASNLAEMCIQENAYQDDIVFFADDIIFEFRLYSLEYIIDSNSSA